MEKYQILCMIGEGSFGRVYKARHKSGRTTVAIKLISKYKRSEVELTTLRKECEIQRHFEHPNIIRLLDSFETPSEIVMVTEFAHQDLYNILIKESYLREERARRIIYDLISALHYLHSNRVLHRDLKPQNVLLGEHGEAKLCDFGFARNMSNSTHVLTSIKGTPLYMAPELMKDYPTYDHNADIWSLGCIAYEMLVGAPPFTTTSILHLVRMIREEPIKWPEYISPECQDLLKGLLNKDPTQRLTWPHLLWHPFVKGRVLILGDELAVTPLTVELTSSQARAKEIQKNDYKNRLSVRQKSASEGNACINTDDEMKLKLDAVDKTDLAFQKMSISQSEEAYFEDSNLEEDLREALNCEESENVSSLEADEWKAFLQRSMEELMDGDVESIKDPAFLNMVCRALSLKYSSVLEYTTSLLSLPFSLDGMHSEDHAKIRKVFMKVKLVPKLVYASKLLVSRTDHDSNFSADQLQALEKILLLITYLVHTEDQSLKQFCSLSVTLRLPSHLCVILKLRGRKIRLAIHVIGILCHILRKQPRYSNIVEEVIKFFNNPETEIRSMLSLESEMLCIRTLALISLLASVSPRAVQSFFTESLAKDVESLTKCSQESISSVACNTLESFRALLSNNDNSRSE